MKYKILHCLIFFLTFSALEFSVFPSEDLNLTYDPQAQEQYYLALESFRHRQYEEALKLAYAIVESYPKSEAAFKAEFLIGEALLKLSRKNEAIEVFETIIKLYPESFEARERIGDYYKSLKKSEEAINLYKEALKLASAEKRTRAQIIKSKLVELERTFAGENWNKGNEIRKKAPQRSKKYFSRTAELYEDIISFTDKVNFNYHDLYMLGECYMRLEEYEKANEAFEKYERWAVTNNMMVDSLLKVYLFREKFPELIDLYLKFQETNFPQYDYVWAIESYAKDEEKLSKLLLSLEERNKHEKDNLFLVWALSVCYESNGERDRAIAFCKRALELRPNEKFFLNYLGSLYQRSKMYQEAINCFEKAKAIYPKEYDYYEWIAEIYLDNFEEKDKKIKAIAVIKDALKNCPSSPHLLERVDRIYKKCKNFGLQDIEIEQILIRHEKTRR